MRLPTAVAAILIQLSVLSFSQTKGAQPAFEVASVRPSRQQVGPDYNNQITYSPGRFVARNATLKRLIAEAWQCQINQVAGPQWIDRNEYDIEARVPDGQSQDEVYRMLRSLLLDRFQLKQHSEAQLMRVYELSVSKSGAKIRPVQAGAPGVTGPGFHFRGDMRHFADLLAVQFSIPAADNPAAPVKAGGSLIPVLDKTGFQGTYDISVDLHPELGTDAFTGWKRALEEQLGLKIESRQDRVQVVVVEDAARIPTVD